jgi:hypothetical protein
LHPQTALTCSSVAESPALKLAVVAVPVTENLSEPLDQLHRILVDAPQDEAAPMRGERKPEPQIGLAAAGLAPIEQLVGLAKIGVALRPRIGHPG